MTLEAITPTNNWISAKFDCDFQITAIWYNDRRVKLTPNRVEAIWKFFNSKFDLQEEYYNQHYWRERESA